MRRKRKVVCDVWSMSSLQAVLDALNADDDFNIC